MGKNKHNRKLIAGQIRTIERHEAKILAELENPQPNIERIKGWEREIDIARKQMRKLEERLEK